MSRDAQGITSAQQRVTVNAPSVPGQSINARSHQHVSQGMVLMKQKKKTFKTVFLWSPRIQSFLELEPKSEYIKVAIIIQWLDERYATFREFKPRYKPSVVGRCLTHLGHPKHANSKQGWIYRRKDAIQGLSHLPDVQGSKDVH